MASEATFFMLPVGRCVFTDTRTKDDKGQPLVNSAGEAYATHTIGIAIAKGGESSWQETEWGKVLVAQAQADWKNGQHGNPSFSWKVEDGDSTVPNKKGNKNCDREGWPGHWVIKPSTNFAVKMVDKNGGPTNLTWSDVYPGCYVQAYCSTKGNGRTDSPGVFVNLEILAFSANGERIQGTGGVDPTTVGFGQAPLPAGAQAAPSGMATQQPAAAAPPPPAQAAQPAPPPRQEFSAGATGAPPPPPAAPVDRLTDKARQAGVTSIEQMLAWDGWTEQALVQHGYLTP